MEPTTYWDDFRRGDRKAFEILYKKYFNDLYDYGMRHVSNDVFIRDCLQAFFLYLWTKREKISEPRSLETYLLISFRRYLFRQLKKEKKYYLFHGESFELFTEPINSHEYQIIWNEDRISNSKWIKSALKELTPRQQEVVYLRYFQQLTPSEIADIMEVNYQTALNHLSEGIKKLRKVAVGKAIALARASIFLLASFLYIS